MSRRKTVSSRTRNNWLIDAAVFFSAVIAALSGVYFLYWPSGGGHTTANGTRVLFERATWSDLHTWGGVIMILAVVIHFAIHWRWVTMMSKKVARFARSDGTRLSRGAWTNVLIDLVIAISFVLTAASGLYFLFGPSGGYQGGRNPDWDPGFLFSRTTWDLVHTWAGVALVLAAVLHLVIHWRWVKSVTVKVLRAAWPGTADSQPKPARAGR